MRDWVNACARECTLAMNEKVANQRKQTWHRGVAWLSAQGKITPEGLIMRFNLII